MRVLLQKAAAFDERARLPLEDQEVDHDRKR
jgi:hypothetical protein